MCTYVLHTLKCCAWANSFLVEEETIDTSNKYLNPKTYCVSEPPTPTVSTISGDSAAPNSHYRREPAATGGHYSTELDETAWLINEHQPRWRCYSTESVDTRRLINALTILMAH